MLVGTADGGSIEGLHLDGWSVLPGGMQVRLDLVVRDGQKSGIVLPFDALTSLLVTLPRIMQAALDARFADGSLRVVQHLGDWRLEQAEGDHGLILRLGTPDGFEVAFALNGRDAGQLGAALLTARDSTNRCDGRKPH